MRLILRSFGTQGDGVLQNGHPYMKVQIRRFPVHHLPFPRLAYPAIGRLLWIFSRIKPLPVSLLHRLARFTPWVPDLRQGLEQLSFDKQFDLVAGMTICFEPLIEAGLRFARRQG